MVTLEKLGIFKRFCGDPDWFARSANERERQMLSDEEWYLIETLLQDATVLVRDLGSPNRSAEANQRLTENCESVEVINEIKRLATVG